jgi:hypothetical protein
VDLHVLESAEPVQMHHRLADVRHAERLADARVDEFDERRIVELPALELHTDRGDRLVDVGGNILRTERRRACRRQDGDREEAALTAEATRQRRSKHALTLTSGNLVFVPRQHPETIALIDFEQHDLIARRRAEAACRSVQSDAPGDRHLGRREPQRLCGRIHEQRRELERHADVC